MWTQPTYFRTLCEWTLCNRPHSASHPRLEGYNRRKAAAPPPVCVDVYVSEADERTRRDPLLPQTNREKALQQNPKPWMVSGQEKKKERKHVVHHVTQTHRVGCSGNTNPTLGGKEQQMHPKEQNDAVNCFFCFWFVFFVFLQKSFLPVPLLQIQSSAQTSANALKFGDRCGTQALFDPLHAQKPFRDPGD